MGEHWLKVVQNLWEVFISIEDIQMPLGEGIKSAVFIVGIS